jgi:ribosomal protein S18 acetylase RimI-like enzyme
VLSELRIRDATTADLPTIADIHASSWRVAYRGIFADAFLDGDLVEDHKTRWAGIAERLTPQDNLLIATDGEGAVGFIAGWTSSALGCDDGYGLYINNLHVRPDLRGKRYGESLCRALARNAKANTTVDAKIRAYLWVLDGNALAHRFYHRLGGRDGEHQLTELGGRTIGETRIVWDDFGLVARDQKARK